MAQIEIMPIVVEKQESKQRSSIAREIQMPLDIPFWDDFSTDSLRDDHWVNSENVFLNDGLSFTPPSLGVISFDGLDKDGNPYGAGSSSGLVDSLSSQVFDLSAYSFANDIYMSFFYQAGGLGDLPNDDDSLRLEFFTDEGAWEVVWPTNESVNRDREYHQVILPISEERFLHDGFRFRFQSVGNVSGMFDIWNLDYIYINENRNIFDLSYPDRAVNEPLNAFLGDYYRVPYTHYNDTLKTTPSFWIRNNVLSSPNQNRAYQYEFSYQIDVSDSLGNTTIFTGFEEVDPLESPIFIGTTEEVLLRVSIDDFGGIEDADSAYVLLEIVLDAEDNKPINDGGDYDPSKYAPVDFRFNDTLRMEYLLTDHYAYDDGTAEAAAGLNFAGDQLAYEYVVISDTSEFITAVDMYFPFTGDEPAGRSIDITVWAEEGGIPGEVLYREQAIIQRPPGLNEFVRYQLLRPVAVADTIFIGYRQNNNGALGLGLDRNTLTTERMYFNLDALWENNTLVQGSLMMRPVFAQFDDTIVSNEDDLFSSPRIYPNPGTGQFNIPSGYRNWTVRDLQGRIILTGDGSDKRLDISGETAGMYLFSGEFNGRQVHQKLILKR